MSDQPPILVAAGGTGGHVFPATAFLDALKAQGRRGVLATDGRGRRFIDDSCGFEVHELPAARAQGGFAGRTAALVALVDGWFQARALLRRVRPLAVVGFGGYATVPLALAASRAVPLILHEQNRVLGRANRMLARRAQLIACGFPDPAAAPAGAPPLRHIGVPIRRIARDAGAPYALPTADQPFRLAVFGGSQGARALSQLGVETAAALPEAIRQRLRVTQQARPEDVEATTAAYRAAGVDADVRPFFQDLPTRIAQAHLVMARAGASTIAEITALGRPSILIPLPTAKDDHQTANAAYLKELGAAIVAPERDVTGERLAKLVHTLIDQPERLAALSTAAHAAACPDAADALIAVVDALIQENA